MFKKVTNEILYHINRKNGLNTYSLLQIGDVIETNKKKYNPFRNSYEICFLPYEKEGEIDADPIESAKTYWRFTKELAIEQTRISINPDLPSRWHGIWLSDEEHLGYWEQMALINKEKYQIVKMKLNGVLFEGDAHWIELSPTPLEKVREKAYYYWNGCIFRPGKMEYIFEGKAEVIELVKHSF